MKSFRDIIDLWPSLTEFAADIGVRYGTAQVMRFRSQLRDEHWVRVVAAAEKRNLPVTYQMLAEIAAARKPKSKSRGNGRRAEHRPAA